MARLTGRLLRLVPPWAAAAVRRSTVVLTLWCTTGEGRATGRQCSSSQTHGEVSRWQRLDRGRFCRGGTMDDAGKLTTAPQEGMVGRCGTWARSARKGKCDACLCHGGARPEAAVMVARWTRLGGALWRGHTDMLERERGRERRWRLPHLGAELLEGFSLMEM